MQLNAQQSWDWLPVHFERDAHGQMINSNKAKGKASKLFVEQILTRKKYMYMHVKGKEGLK